MRIALVAPLVTAIHEPQLGGSQALVVDLAQGLTSRGHEVDVFAASGSAIAGVRVVDTGVDAGELAALLYRADRPAAVASEKEELAFARAFDLVGRGQYDVVHNHAFDPPAVRCATSIAMPVIHTLHLPPEASMAAAINQALHSAHQPTIAVVSEHAAAAWRLVTTVDCVLRDGVPVDRIAWSDEGGGELLFAGRFSPEKGAADAIAIARRAGVPITLYGEPYDPDYARRYVEPHRGQRGVTIQGAIPRAEIWQRMAASLAVVCPSKWDEPFGLVAAEAQAAGTPVIAYDRGDLSELVIDRKTGFVVPADNIDAAAAAVDRLSEINRVDCRRHAEAQLNLDDTITAHERLYEKLASAANLRRDA